jgi:hypothetical protein
MFPWQTSLVIVLLLFIERSGVRNVCAHFRIYFSGFAVVAIEPFLGVDIVSHIEGSLTFGADIYGQASPTIAHVALRRIAVAGPHAAMTFTFWAHSLGSCFHSDLLGRCRSHNDRRRPKCAPIPKVLFS